MKKLTLLTVLCTAFYFAGAQATRPAANNNAFADSLTLIVADFASNFKNLQGERLPGEVDADLYQSTAGLPGAVYCTIKRYHSKIDNSASWQCVAYTGENYEDAAKAYKKIFSQVKSTRLKGIGTPSSSFEGSMETADENVRFAVSTLKIKTTDWHFANLVADVELMGSYAGWEVHLSLYYKRKDTDGPTE